MVFVLVILAVALAIAAYQTSDRGVRVFFLACCLLNLSAAAKMIYEEYPYAYELRPSDGVVEPAYRR